MVLSLRILFGLIGQCIHPYLFHHSQQAIAACGTEMVSQPYAVDEKQVGIKDFLRSMTTQDTKQQGDESFDYQSITLGLEKEQTVVVVSMYPHAALTTIDKVALGLKFLFQRLHVVAQVDEQLVFVHPVGEVGEFLHHLVLQCFYAHGFVVSIVG